MIYLATNLKRLRKWRGCSQAVMAAGLDIKRTAYSAYETDGIEPKLATLERMRERFRISLDKLILWDLSGYSDEQLRKIQLMVMTPDPQ